MAHSFCQRLPHVSVVVRLGFVWRAHSQLGRSPLPSQCLRAHDSFNLLCIPWVNLVVGLFPQAYQT